LRLVLETCFVPYAPLRGPSFLQKPVAKNCLTTRLPQSCWFPSYSPVVKQCYHTSQ